MNKLLNKEPDRIEQLVSEKRVKLHLFEPSQRKIWTVVGKLKNIGLILMVVFVLVLDFILVQLMVRLLVII